MRGFLARFRAHERALAELQQRRRTRARLVAEALAAEFGVRRVWLFGSLARGEATARSDIDLLVDDLTASQLMAASALADRIMGEAYVDMLPVSLTRPDVRAEVEASGELIYG
ncbi:MAG: nucleotidyltransferase domain-containing protein [Myxococcota bacterium]|mgnify:CR=1 FL=1